MTETKVLVVYGTKYGSTGEIAEWIAEELRNNGLDAEARPAASAPPPDGYGAVVLGGGLYAGRWQRSATRYARRHREALRSSHVWLFSSGPLDDSAGGREIPPVPGVARLVTSLGVREHRTFGGRLDETARGFVASRLVKSGRGGDFRDREAIRGWAAAIAKELVNR